MSYRAISSMNGTLPIPTGIIQGFMRDPSKAPFLKYTQLIAADEIRFSYFRIHPDDAVRLPSLNQNVWPYDDYRPTGRDFKLHGDWIDARMTRYDFPYQIGDTTQRIWKNQSKIDPKVMYDQIRAGHAMLHRASRVVNALGDAAWPTYNTGTPQELLGAASPVYFDESSGEELLASGNMNPNFQNIKKTLQEVKKRIHLMTNAALTGEELIWVISPRMANAVASSGEIVNFLKQSPFAKELTDPNIRDWNLPPSYAGFTIVVEDTPRVFINFEADGSIAEVGPTGRGYILDDDTSYFLSRPGGLDGIYGGRSFSTVQCFHFGGEARVQAFSEPKHELTEGHVVMEDKIELPALISGFKLTGALSS